VTAPVPVVATEKVTLLPTLAVWLTGGVRMPKTKADGRMVTLTTGEVRVSPFLSSATAVNA